jgi:uncharacterized protein
MEDKSQLVSIIHKEKWLIDLLHVIRDLNLLDWFITAGTIRNTVWDVLHNYTERHINDIDVAYFDPNNKNSKIDRELQNKLKKLRPNYDWDVFNQTRAKDVNPHRPIPISSCDSIGYYSETPTCIGVRLEKDNSLTICAEYGLSDLMNLIVKPIPPPKQDLALYNKRIAKKQWDKIWPKLKIF